MSSLTGKKRDFRTLKRHTAQRLAFLNKRRGDDRTRERGDEDVNTKAGTVSTSDTISGKQGTGRAFRAGNGKGWETQ